MREAPERTTIITGSGGSGGGMGMGIMLGAILVVVVGIAIFWLVMSGRMPAVGTDKPIEDSPSINITGPDINFPDTITINPPAPANTPAP